MHNNTARIKLIASMAIFGTLPLFVRNISVSSGELALYRATLAAALLIIYFLAAGKKLNMREIKKELPLLFFSGAAMGINWILLFQSYRYTTVSISTLSYYFAPVIVTVLCPILFRERLTAKQLICSVMATAGLILVVLFQKDGGAAQAESHLLGVLFGLGAALFYAAVIILNKYIKNVGGIERTFFQFIAAIIVLVPYVLLTDGINLGSLGGIGWGCLITVGLIHTGITYCLYFSSLRELNGQETAILSYIDPLVAVIVSVAILGEPIALPQIAGGILILGFTLWNELGSSKK
ncbi:MAG: EamA/RhaT family transporter [Ruminococcaceae bacterium]|nr:EamA/RhaT family transporter [Oscillospiraceae bacterium]